MDARKIKRVEKGMLPFPTRLTLLLKERDMNQEELAGIIGKSRQAVSLYCNGTEPDHQTLVRIARFFCVSTDYLLGIEDEKTHAAASVAEQTGLDEKAVSVLKSAKEPKENPFDREGKAIQEFINALLTSDEIGKLAISFVNWAEEANTHIERRRNEESLLDYMVFDKSAKKWKPKEAHIIRDGEGKIIGYSKQFVEFGNLMNELSKSERKANYMEAGARHSTVRGYERFISEQYRKMLDEYEEGEHDKGEE